jgi:hypothetical protein
MCVFVFILFNEKSDIRCPTFFGDYKRAKAFMNNWGFIPSELPQIIESLSDIPTAVNPVWDLSELK